MSTEQRRHTRYAVRLGAEVTFRGETIAATAQNLSEGGVGIACRSLLDEDAKIGLALFLTQDGIEDPDTPAFEVNATVMWSGESDGGLFAAGVRFEGLSATERARLAGFLAALTE